jgi:GNAT superfamily N-acetyltransferase
MTERIRPAAESDLDAMMALVAARERANARGGPSLFEALQAESEAGRVAALRRMMATDMERGGQVALVAEDEGRVVGYALVMDLDGLSPGLPAPTAAVNELAIEPERWPGAGRTLLHAALDAAERRGAEQILVMTETTDPAHGGDLTAAGLTRIAENWYTGVQQPQQRDG